MLLLTKPGKPTLQVKEELQHPVSYLCEICIRNQGGKAWVKVGETEGGNETVLGEGWEEPKQQACHLGEVL